MTNEINITDIHMGFSDLHRIPVAQYLVICVVFCRLFLSFSFGHCIVLSVFDFVASYYPFGVFKFLITYHIKLYRVLIDTGGNRTQNFNGDMQ
jgi:hypothetical protein